MEPIILASSSPRRQAILKMLNIPFQVIIPDIDETIFDSENILKIPEQLAIRKTKGVLETIPQDRHVPWVLAADTLINFNNKLYGKPANSEEAFTYIQTLQGKSHEVITSIALYNGKTKKISTSTNMTKVEFKPMTDKEIAWYVGTEEWHGAAGAYRIQGIASCFIKHIDGLMSTVVGLPISNLYDILAEQNYSFLE